VNARQRGDLSELIALTKLAKQGYRVAIPFGNCEGFDLLVEGSDGPWKKVQVKSAYRRGARKNRIYVDTIRGCGSTKKRGYKEGSFDYLIAVLPEEEAMWVMEFSRIKGRRCLTIGDDQPRGMAII